MKFTRAGFGNPYEKTYNGRREHISEDNDNYPIARMEILAASKNLCFSKSHFPKGVVTIRDNSITINEITVKPHPHKTPKQSKRKKRSGKVR